MTSSPAPEARAERFVRELAELRIPDPAAAHAALWLRLGGLLMAAGLVLGALAFPLAHATDNSLAQGDALALGLGGIAAAVVGGALFLRYSLTGFLRFWLARQSYDLDRLGERLTALPGTTATTTPLPEGDPRNGVPRTDPAPR
ncbi:hypothetical protein RKE30_16620 [Streptomyces sp. Li-HN-5-11]|uniref:hypothetical protein n=1 Tax=Streptomyces sp. Li-HN-5-11 TaxID=3075432 RepID=UPI0028A68BB7|nr:hypothetical protein [Streptomyces sp. Li-HN-5-11]WNM31918.1 hypothetical protein RKE30_16620 [Streptomyces sp. Li-HN-5-11]